MDLDSKHYRDIPKESIALCHQKPDQDSPTEMEDGERTKSRGSGRLIDAKGLTALAA